ncbi:isocitrate lyase/PEP mutase family protein [Catellatospora chokoriensis]|uniref:Carboxyvinyl-carboxyphosphonate phosphorylmutase n=1 Tax=Catellatospora chokoriensis TaxID=310353 RepID=A0A8J3NV34_9ACTN|nr:isocitrate lyase/phosphoenolpyruvate mutase family protein [Catellatospora chokoriensis]GIF93523.1 carboxyvinyl-carboxyphosphonate phosphorylmutase [Catellatospora chokoriensis]
MTAAALRALLAAGGVTHLPGVYDPPTATLAVRAGHRAAHLSGAACAALDLGLPDLGYVHGTHIAERAARITPALGGVPLLADADTGYGDALQAVWTARRYAAAGVSGLHLEDQVMPKRCGHLAGKELADADTAARKIRAVVSDGTGIVVVARTDAYTVTGLDDAIARGRAYAAAGADAVFLEGVSGLDELGRAHAALPGVPLVLNRSEAAGDTSAAASDAELAAVGVRLVLHPVAPLLAALHAADRAYREIAATGLASVARLAWSEFTGLVGQDEALALDARSYG